MPALSSNRQNTLATLLSSAIDEQNRAQMQHQASTPYAPAIPARESLRTWAKGVGERSSPTGMLTALASEAKRFTDMPIEEKLGQLLGHSGGSLSGLAGIVSPKIARTLNTSLNIPKQTLFNEAVGNTPNAQITQEGLLMRLQRNQQPAQSLEPSVRGGVFYLPEGAAQAKHYSTGKAGYGGKEKITGETLIQNPLFVKGATGGKAPEAAYDQLLGKGSYENMRKDALSAMGGWNAPKHLQEERIEDFLSKYAPELQGQGYNILQNSKSGNQLPYALQEAAVASKVRSAGYDAVLGHSKGKSGPFISEVFDVRESHYPSVSGESEVWDAYRSNK